MGDSTLRKEARALDAAIMALPSAERVFAEQTVTSIVAGATSFGKLPPAIGDLAFALLGTIVRKRMTQGMLSAIGVGRDRENEMFEDLLAGFSPEFAEVVRQAASK